MPAAFDAKTFAQASGFGTTVSGTHTPVGSPTLALMKIFYDHASATVSGTPAYAATAMTLVDGPRRSSTTCTIYIYRLENPPSGAQAFSYSLSNSNVRRCCVVETYTGTVTSGATGTPATAGSTGTAATVNVTSVANDLVTDLVAYANFGGSGATFSPGVGQTENWEDVDTAGANRAAGSTETASGATITMSWTISDIRPWVMIGVALTPAALQNGVANVTSATTVTAAATLVSAAAANVVAATTVTASGVAVSAATASATVVAATTVTASAQAGMFAAPVIPGTVAGSPYIQPYTVATFGSGTPPTVYLALQLIAIGTGSGGLEVPFSNGYARQPIANDGTGWTALAGGGVQQTAIVTFDEATAAWGTVVGWSLRDAATGGNVLAFGLFGRSQAVFTDSRFMVPARNLTLLASYATASLAIAEITPDVWSGNESWVEGNSEWGKCQTCDRSVPVHELLYNRRYGWQCVRGRYGIGCYDGPMQRDEYLRLPAPGEGDRLSATPASGNLDDDWTLEE